MKLKLKIVLLSLMVTLVLGSMLNIVIEYTMSLNTKQEIELAEREKLAEIEKQKALEDEKKYQAEELIKVKNSYDKVEDYYYGLALVRRDNKYGYIDINGNEVIKLQYDIANNFTNKDYAKVKKDGKWGYITQNGTEIIPIQYAYCGEVSNGIVAVGNGGKYGFITIEGKEVCGLIYDKVEAFDSSGLAKVVLNQKYGYIDRNGVEKVGIVNPYVEENVDFTGEWKQTDIHSSKAGTVIISGQIATSFNFEITSKYFSKSDSMVGTANIVKSNTAIYEYNSGSISETLTFAIVDDQLIVSAKNTGNCGMSSEVTAVGTYTLDVPQYTNDNVMKRVFEDNDKLFDRIKNALGEDVYEEYFLYGFKNGEYKIKELKENSDIIKGMLYIVTVPTMEKDFKLLISNNSIYFFAKHKEIYKTDDDSRQSIARMPSAIAFDEI